MTTLEDVLQTTLGSLLHCRTPMKRMDPEELAARAPVQLDGRCTTIGAGKNPAPDEVATYRCMCGFTMDAPSVARDYAIAS